MGEELNITLEFSRDWIDYALLISPFGLLLLAWAGSWLLRKHKSLNETKTRLAITRQWLGKLIESIDENRIKLVEFREQIRDIDRDIYDYTKPSFPIDDLHAIDFEKSFTSHVINVEDPDKAVKTFYDYRKVLRSLDRHQNISDHVVDHFGTALNERRSSHGKAWTQFQEYYYKFKAGILTDGNVHEQAQMALLSNIDEEITERMQAAAFDTWPREECFNLANGIFEEMKRNGYLRSFFDLIIHAKEFIGSHRELLLLHEGAGSNLDGLIETLDELKGQVESLINDYSSIEIKNLFKIT